MRGHCLSAVQGYSSVLVNPVRLSTLLLREAVDFPLLEVFSLTSDRPLPGMNKVPCLETRESSKWIFKVPFSCTGVSV